MELQYVNSRIELLLKHPDTKLFPYTQAGHLLLEAYIRDLASIGKHEAEELTPWKSDLPDSDWAEVERFNELNKQVEELLGKLRRPAEEGDG